MIGILTFYWADDYGAMLQAYALKKYLEMSGRQVKIIPYAPLRLSGRYRFVPVIAFIKKEKIRYSFNYWMFRRNLSMGAAFWKRRRNMRAFRRRYLTDEHPIKRAEDISLRKYSCVFVGSDQVWNPEITVGFDDAYLGRVRDRGACRLAAYGASFGSARLPERERDELTEAIRENFAAISLREKRAADFMSECLQRAVANVLDPTLLLDRVEWERIAKMPAEKDYILIYNTEQNERMMDYARALAKSYRKKVLTVSVQSGLPHRADVQVEVSGGPAEFLGYVQNAWCVVTNSFHGTAFSILMEKQFLVFAHSSRNERMESLLKKLGLEDRLVYVEEKVEEQRMFTRIDWQRTEQCLKRERDASIQFIEGNIEQ